MTILDTAAHHGARKQTRLDFESLESYIHAGWGPDPDIEFVNPRWADHRTTNTFIGMHCNVNHATAGRWRREGITIHAADRATIALGVHPVEIWPNYGDLAIHEGATNE